MPRSWVPMLAIAAALVVTAACGGKSSGAALAEDVGKAVGQAIRNGDVPRTLPKGYASRAPSLVELRTAEWLKAYDDLDKDALMDVVEAACKANDLMQEGQATSWQGAIDRAVGDSGTAAARRDSVQALAETISATDTNRSDLTGRLAVKHLCEIVN